MTAVILDLRPRLARKRISAVVVDSDPIRAFKAASILADNCEGRVGGSDRPEPKEWR